MNELYTPDDFPGDEDNGEMASWYLFNALGFYPLCPGHPSYVLSTPLFPKATVTLENGGTFVIEAPANSSENCYVNGVTLNGAAHAPLWISHDAIAAGGAMTFAMASAPAPRAFAESDLPYSLSAYPAMSAGTDPFAPSVKINCGATDASEDFAADCYVAGGEAAQGDGDGVYATQRRGAFQYALPRPALPEGSSYTVRLHHSESDARPSGVRVGGKSVEASSGARVTEAPRVRPDSAGLILIDISDGSLSAIEILAE